MRPVFGRAPVSQKALDTEASSPPGISDKANRLYRFPGLATDQIRSAPDGAQKERWLPVVRAEFRTVRCHAIRLRGGFCTDRWTTAVTPYARGLSCTHSGSRTSPVPFP